MEMDYRLSGRLDLSAHSSCPPAERVGRWQVSQPASTLLLQGPPTRQGACQKSKKMKLTSVTSLALGFISQSNACTRMNNSGLLNNQTITVKTRNVAARVGKSNLVNFIGVQPDLTLSAFQYGSGEALLKFKRN